MSKHTHHQSKAEQIDNKAHGVEPFHYNPYQASEKMESKKEEVINDNPVQNLAYKIYQEKGGFALDNWLEAERILKII